MIGNASVNVDDATSSNGSIGSTKGEGGSDATIVRLECGVVGIGDAGEVGGAIENIVFQAVRSVRIPNLSMHQPTKVGFSHRASVVVP